MTARDIRRGETNGGRLAPLTRAGLGALPIFTGLVLLQVALTPAFDLQTMPLSVLALGPIGWVQTANFVVVGAMIIVSAIGVGAVLKTRGGRFASAMLLLYGLGTVAAGVFPSDVIDGFPAGAVQAEAISLNAQLHGAAFAAAHLGLIAAAATFAGAFLARRSTGWAILCIATVVVVPLLITLGFGVPSVRGGAFFTTGLVTMGWLGLVSWKLSVRPNT